MNDTIRNIKSRRSVKKYKNDNVSDDLINEIVSVGTCAPSGMNRQSPIIIKVTNKEVRDKLSRLNAKILGNENIDPFYNAPVVLVVLADKNISTYLYDGSLVIGNMLLAAHSLGLGACWIHRAKEMFESDDGKEILSSLGIGDNYEGIGNCIIGYPDEERNAPLIKDNYVYEIK